MLGRRSAPRNDAGGTNPPPRVRPHVTRREYIRASHRLLEDPPPRRVSRPRPPVPPLSAAPTAEAHARFHALVLPHLDRLLGFARRRTADLAAAENAVQEACMRAWTGFGELRDPASARAWLYRILRTVLADGRERDDRRERLVSMTRLEDAHEAFLADPDGEADPVFADVAARLDSTVVHAALAAIPDDFAAPVELHDIDGFKYQEIADVLGIPIGTVMSRISRGRRLLAGAVMTNRRAWLDGAPAAPASSAGSTVFGDASLGHPVGSGTLPLRRATGARRGGPRL